jgi:hypothetical protein
MADTNLIQHIDSTDKKCDRCNRGILRGSYYGVAFGAEYGPECLAHALRVGHLFSDPEQVRELVRTQYKLITGARTKAGMAKRKANA